MLRQTWGLCGCDCVGAFVHVVLWMIVCAGLIVVVYVLC